jgi:hypothetical protein
MPWCDGDVVEGQRVKKAEILKAEMLKWRGRSAE